MKGQNGLSIERVTLHLVPADPADRDAIVAEDGGRGVYFTQCAMFSGCVPDVRGDCQFVASREDDDLIRIMSLKAPDRICHVDPATFGRLIDECEEIAVQDSEGIRPLVMSDAIRSAAIAALRQQFQQKMAETLSMSR